MTDLYIIQAQTTGAIKIGRSKNVQKRIKQIQTGCPYSLKLLLRLRGFGHIEQSLHVKLGEHRIRFEKGEWFHEAGLVELPTWIYEQLDLSKSDWWKNPRA